LTINKKLLESAYEVNDLFKEKKVIQKFIKRIYMSPNYKAELVGVFGHPVSKNPTVVMLEAAFNALSLNWKYLTKEVLPEYLEDAMKGLRAFNMRGINLTIPHKVEV
jgi:hypothetical protein